MSDFLPRLYDGLAITTMFCMVITIIFLMLACLTKGRRMFQIYYIANRIGPVIIVVAMVTSVLGLAILPWL